MSSRSSSSVSSSSDSDDEPLSSLLGRLGLGDKTGKVPEKRKSLTEALNLIRKAEKIIVLTGAGISVSCGIPDFRSKNGLYATLAKDYPELPSPQHMFCIDFFKKNPKPFFRFAEEILPGRYQPSVSHKFITYLDEQKKLLRLYSQNIDALERAAGIKRLIECHGHIYTAHCVRCQTKYELSDIRTDIEDGRVPLCTACDDEGRYIKPDIVFFGEGLPEEFFASLDDDKSEADLLIVMGTSMAVGPVNQIPHWVPKKVPRLLINREHISGYSWDHEFLGNSDEVVEFISSKLDFDIKATKRTFVGKAWPNEDNNNEQVKVVSGQYCSDPSSSLTYFYSQ